MKLFIDTNILIDILLDRCLEKSSINEVISKLDKYELYISAITIPNIIYILKVKYNSHLYNLLNIFLEQFTIIPLSEDIISSSLRTEYTDYEDLIQFLSAEKYCNVILTRNNNDFEKLKKSLNSDVLITSFI